MAITAKEDGGGTSTEGAHGSQNKIQGKGQQGQDAMSES